MCFNATTTLITFSVSALCFIFLLYRGIKTNNKNDIFLSFLTIVIGFMQLIEFFIWRNQKCNKINHYFSLGIILLLFLQGAIMNIVYLKLYPESNAFFSKNTIYYCIIAFLLVTIYVLYYLNKQLICSKPGKSTCRLVWDGLVKLNYNLFLYFTFMFFYFLMAWLIILNSIGYNNLLTKYPLRYSFLFITFVLTGIYVLINSNFYEELLVFLKNKNIFSFLNKMRFLSSNDAFGSLWCFSSVFVGIIGILQL
jgi:hypothetical protein